MIWTGRHLDCRAEIARLRHHQVFNIYENVILINRLGQLESTSPNRRFATRLILLFLLSVEPLFAFYGLQSCCYRLILEPTGIGHAARYVAT